MRLTSAAYDAEVAGTTAGDVLEVNAWRGGSLLAATLDVSAWSLNWDADRQVQGQGTFTVPDPDGNLAPWGLSDALAPGGSRLQVTWVSGLSGVRIPLGWWRIRKATPTESWRLLRTSTPTATVQPVAHTNLAPNPDAEAYGAVTTIRTNAATHPNAKAYVSGTVANLGWNNTRWFGGPPGAGTYTLVSGASDGPLSTITSYARKTWTVAPASSLGDTGFATNNWTGFVPGAVYVISGWLRSSIARTSVGWEVWFGDATGVLQRTNWSTGNVAANTWARFSITVTAPAAGSGATYLAAILDTDGSQAIAAGTTLDAAGLLVEQQSSSYIGSTNRTNLHPNPSVHRTVGTWNAQTGGATWTTTRETAPGSTNGASVMPFAGAHPWYKITATVTNTGSPVGINSSGTTVANGAVAVTAGQSYSFALYHVSSMAASTTTRIVVAWLDAAGAIIGAELAGANVANTANVWQRLTLLNQTAPAGAVAARVGVRQSATAGTFPVGGYIGCTGVQAERATTLGVYVDGYTMGGATSESAWTGALGSSTSVIRNIPSVPAVSAPGAYFDGSTPAAGDFSYAWNGTADASASRQQAPNVAGVSAYTGGNAVRWSSLEHTRGTRSLALQRIAASVTGWIWNTPAPLAVGEYMTFRARVKTAVAGGTFTLYGRGAGGGGVGSQAYVGTGDWQDIYIAVQNTAASGANQVIGAQLLVTSNGTILYTDETLMVVESAPYTGPYFDGRTPGTSSWHYAWTGAADASTSTASPVTVAYASAVVRLPGGGQVVVNADEETATVVLNRLDAEVAVGPQVVAEITRLLRDVCPVKVLAGVTDAAIPATLVYGDSRMDAVEDLLTVIRATHRMAGDGSLEILPQAGVGPVWTLAGGEDGVLVELSRALSDDAVYNAVRSDSETASGQPLVGRAYTASGPLAWGGPFGKVPLFHKSVAVTAPGVQQDAETLLASRQTAGEVDLDVTCLAHPGVQPHDRVTLLAATVTGDQAITGRVVGMSLSAASSGDGITPAKAMGLTVRVASNDLEAIASRVRRG